MAGDPSKMQKAADSAAVEPEPSAECPDCGSGNVQIVAGGAARCGKCGVALTETVGKDGRGTGYAVLESPTSKDTERGTR